MAHLEALLYTIEIHSHQLSEPKLDFCTWVFLLTEYLTDEKEYVIQFDKLVAILCKNIFPDLNKETVMASEISQSFIARRTQLNPIETIQFKISDNNIFEITDDDINHLVTKSIPKLLHRLSEEYFPSSIIISLAVPIWKLIVLQFTENIETLSNYLQYQKILYYLFYLVPFTIRKDMRDKMVSFILRHKHNSTILEPYHFLFLYQFLPPYHILDNALLDYVNNDHVNPYDFSVVMPKISNPKIFFSSLLLSNRDRLQIFAATQLRQLLSSIETQCIIELKDIPFNEIVIEVFLPFFKEQCSNPANWSLVFANEKLQSTPTLQELLYPILYSVMPDNIFEGDFDAFDETCKMNFIIFICRNINNNENNIRFLRNTIHASNYPLDETHVRYFLPHVHSIPSSICSFLFEQFLNSFIMSQGQLRQDEKIYQLFNELLDVGGELIILDLMKCQKVFDYLSSIDDITISMASFAINLVSMSGAFVQECITIMAKVKSPLQERWLDVIARAVDNYFGKKSFKEIITVPFMNAMKYLSCKEEGYQQMFKNVLTIENRIITFIEGFYNYDEHDLSRIEPLTFNELHRVEIQIEDTFILYFSLDCTMRDILRRIAYKINYMPELTLSVSDETRKWVDDMKLRDIVKSKDTNIVIECNTPKEPNEEIEVPSIILYNAFNEQFSFTSFANLLNNDTFSETVFNVIKYMPLVEGALKVQATALRNSSDYMARLILRFNKFDSNYVSILESMLYEYPHSALYIMKQLLSIYKSDNTLIDKTTISHFFKDIHYKIPNNEILQIVECMIEFDLDDYHIIVINILSELDVDADQLWKIVSGKIRYSYDNAPILNSYINLFKNYKNINFVYFINSIVESDVVDILTIDEYCISILIEVYQIYYNNNPDQKDALMFVQLIDKIYSTIVKEKTIIFDIQNLMSSIYPLFQMLFKVPKYIMNEEKNPVFDKLFDFLIFFTRNVNQQFNKEIILILTAFLDNPIPIIYNPDHNNLKKSPLFEALCQCSTYLNFISNQKSNIRDIFVTKLLDNQISIELNTGQIDEIMDNSLFRGRFANGTVFNQIRVSFHMSVGQTIIQYFEEHEIEEIPKLIVFIFDRIDKSIVYEELDIPFEGKTKKYKVIEKEPIVLLESMDDMKPFDIKSDLQHYAIYKAKEYFDLDKLRAIFDPKMLDLLMLFNNPKFILQYFIKIYLLSQEDPGQYSTLRKYFFQNTITDEMDVFNKNIDAFIRDIKLTNREQGISLLVDLAKDCCIKNSTEISALRFVTDLIKKVPTTFTAIGEFAKIIVEKNVDGCFTQGWPTSISVFLSFHPERIEFLFETLIKMAEHKHFCLSDAILDDEKFKRNHNLYRLCITLMKYQEDDFQKLAIVCKSGNANIRAKIVSMAIDIALSSCKYQLIFRLVDEILTAEMFATEILNRWNNESEKVWLLMIHMISTIDLVDDSSWKILQTIFRTIFYDPSIEIKFTVDKIQFVHYEDEIGRERIAELLNMIALSTSTFTREIYSICIDLMNLSLSNEAFLQMASLAIKCDGFQVDTMWPIVADFQYEKMTVQVYLLTKLIEVMNQEEFENKYEELTKMTEQIEKIEPKIIASLFFEAFLDRSRVPDMSFFTEKRLDFFSVQVYKNTPLFDSFMRSESDNELKKTIQKWVFKAFSTVSISLLSNEVRKFASYVIEKQKEILIWMPNYKDSMKLINSERFGEEEADFYDDYVAFILKRLSKDANYLQKRRIEELVQQNIMNGLSLQGSHFCKLAIKLSAENPALQKEVLLFAICNLDKHDAFLSFATDQMNKDGVQDYTVVQIFVSEWNLKMLNNQTFIRFIEALLLNTSPKKNHELFRKLYGQYNPNNPITKNCFNHFKMLKILETFENEGYQDRYENEIKGLETKCFAVNIHFNLKLYDSAPPEIKSLGDDIYQRWVYVKGYLTGNLIVEGKVGFLDRFPRIFYEKAHVKQK